MEATENVEQNDSGSSAIPPGRVKRAYPIEKAWELALCRRTGTDIANIDNNTSGRRFTAKAGVRGWGGHRNRTDRASDGVTLEQCGNLIAAARYAAAAGLALNRHVTIHWEKAGIPDSRAGWATGRLLKLANDWTTKSGGQVAYAWARENGDGKGSHVHILLHVPPGLEPWRMVRGWIGSITAHPYRVGTIETKRVGGTANAWRAAPDFYLHNLASVVGYILKGATPAAATSVGMELVEPGGRIIGKRCGTSQNIGRARRRAAGW